MHCLIKSFNALDTTELYAILQLRSAVFVVEQACIYQDIDGKDAQALHVLGYDADTLVAYLRIFKAGDYFKTTAIGRVVVAPESRGKGYAKQLMQTAINHILNQLQEQQITLSAQTYLKAFYKDLGFKIVGKEYLEDGIPHIKMIYA